MGSSQKLSMAFLWRSGDLGCTPGTGVNLWGESPLYMNPVNVEYIDTSTSRKQGRYLRDASQVIYQAKNGKDQKVFDALEWLTNLCSHIPNGGRSTTFTGNGLHILRHSYCNRWEP